MYIRLWFDLNKKIFLLIVKLLFLDRVEDSEQDLEEDKSDSTSTKYNIEFTFDSDSKCAITIYYFAMEDVNNGQIT